MRDLLKMAIVQSNNTGQWGYCPEAARGLLRLELDTDQGEPTAEACVARMKADPTVPKAHTFTLYPSASYRAPKPPRVPTDIEIEDITGAYEALEMGASGSWTRGEAEEIVAGARIVVIDDYITDGPGYTGRVALILHGGGPELFESAVWDGLPGNPERTCRILKSEC